MLKDKGIGAGTSIIYEQMDLDVAWDAYKEGGRIVKHGEWKGKQPVRNVKKQTRSNGATVVQVFSVSSTVAGHRFEDVVAKILGKDRR